ncbi:MAG TPA: mechanosensitive ion channel family protein [Saprospiraceae bacterium]|nr:mechanosensitive ion channel family protein [Saprospiraceae bacterium]
MNWPENIERGGVVIAIIVVTILIAWIVDALFRRFIMRSTRVMNNDPTSYLFLRHAIRALIYILGLSLAIYSLPSLRGIANSLVAGAGILAVAVGFASQHALSNVISGLFIVIFKPYRVNDRLRVRDTLHGIVEDITLRHTVIRDFENRRIIIPNAVISDEVIINSDFGNDNICKWLELTITHQSDLSVAKTILAEEAVKHPLQIDTRKPEDIAAGKPEVLVRVVALDERGTRLRAYIWAKDAADAFAMSCDLLEAIKKRFDEAGITLTYLPDIFKQVNL